MATTQVDTEIDWVIKRVDRGVCRPPRPLARGSGSPTRPRLPTSVATEALPPVSRGAGGTRRHRPGSLPGQDGGAPHHARRSWPVHQGGQEHRRDFTVDWVHLKLNDQAQRTVLAGPLPGRGCACRPAHRGHRGGGRTVGLIGWGSRDFGSAGHVRGWAQFMPLRGSLRACTTSSVLAALVVAASPEHHRLCLVHRVGLGPRCGQIEDPTRLPRRPWPSPRSLSGDSLCLQVLQGEGDGAAVTGIDLWRPSTRFLSTSRHRRHRGRQHLGITQDTGRHRPVSRGALFPALLHPVASGRKVGSRVLDRGPAQAIALGTEQPLSLSLARRWLACGDRTLPSWCWTSWRPALAEAPLATARSCATAVA